ncbi:MAG: hypothetical protein H0U72_05980 [Nitrosospira sp.]|nr:hypothetical protein [Nitrosospira sp.]
MDIMPIADASKICHQTFTAFSFNGSSGVPVGYYYQFDISTSNLMVRFVIAALV